MVSAAQISTLFLVSAAAADAHRLLAYRWISPLSSHSRLFKRQSGYKPELSSCNTGKTCSEACGADYEECGSTTHLAIFCYNPRSGQTCCPNSMGSKYPQRG